MSEVSKSTVEETVVTKNNTQQEFNGKTKVQEGAQKKLDSLVYMDTVKKILEVSQITGENVILYGPGGYGKSDITLAFYQAQGIDPYIITMGTGMTTDRLFGGLDIPAFNKTGKLEYLVENSFMNHEYVIFEELFDAPDFILEQLKDIISSGVFRNGNQVFPIKTKMIVCCTNRTREEFSKNTSLKALMERFPLETKVVWKDHNKITYENLLNKTLGFSDPLLTYVLEEFAKNGTTISPRIAIKAANIVNETGPESLTFIADFNNKADLLKTSITKFESLKKISDYIQIMHDIVLKYDKLNKTDLKGVKEGAALNKTLYATLEKLKAIKADDSMVKVSTEAQKTYTDIYNKNKKELEITMTFDDIVIDEKSTSEEMPF